MTDGSWLPNHPKSGDWYSLKGKMLSPYEMAPLESTSHGSGPGVQPAGGISPDSTITVNTPLTMGGGAMAS